MPTGLRKTEIEIKTRKLLGKFPSVLEHQFL